MNVAAKIWPFFAIVLFWTVVTIQSIAWRCYNTRFNLHPLPLSFIVSVEIVMFSLAGALTPSIVWLTRRFALLQPRWPAAFAVHAGAGLAFALIVKFCWDIGIWTLGLYRTPWIQDFSGTVFGNSLFAGLQANVLLYWVVVIGVTALNFARRHRDGLIEAAELRAQLAEAQLQTLRIQLEPHFLFNSLHVISELVHSDPAAADESIAQLSELLRRSLALHDRQEIPLDEELAFVRLYLNLQGRRYEKRLAVEYQIESHASQGLVPSMILQPLVENSIRHAIALRRNGGCLAIRAGLAGSQLVIEVEDGGGSPATIPAREGVGLRTTRERLQRMYPGTRGLELSPGTGGLRVRVRIPYRVKGEN